MKNKHLSKILIIFVVLVAFSVSAQGQHRITEATYPSQVRHTIVREYTFPATVSYVETASEHYFAYADASMAILNAQIEPNIFVRDFVIFEDYVYFCGFDNSQQTTVGVWGCFKIPDLITSNMSYYTYKNFHCLQQFSDTLHSLVAFRDSANALHIAVVGSVRNGNTSDQSCMLDITGTAGNLGWNYTMGITYSMPYYFEKLSKVCLTDNYVVAVGTIPMGYGVVNHRFHLRNQMFGGTENHFYTFPGDAWPLPWDFAVTALRGDQFAVAVKHDKNNILGYEGIFVYVFHIPSITFGTNAVYSMEANPFSPNDIKIRDLRYSQSTFQLTLLLTGNIGSYSGSYVADLPLPPAASVDASILSDVMLTSLDNYNLQQLFLTQGYDINKQNNVKYYVQPLQTIPVCASPGQKYITQPNYAAKIEDIPYLTWNDAFACMEFHVEDYLLINNKVICSD